MKKERKPKIEPILASVYGIGSLDDLPEPPPHLQSPSSSSGERRAEGMLIGAGFALFFILENDAYC